MISLPVFCHYFAMNGKLWIQKKFCTHILCQRWSRKSFMKIGCLEVPKPSYPPDFDQLSEWSKPFSSYFPKFPQTSSNILKFSLRFNESHLFLHILEMITIVFNGSVFWDRIKQQTKYFTSAMSSFSTKIQYLFRMTACCSGTTMNLSIHFLSGGHFLWAQKPN